MTDVVLTQSQYEALKAVCERANELVTTLPYISMMGGNVTRQNMTVQALATALDAVKDVDFENVRTVNGIEMPQGKYFAGQIETSGTIPYDDIVNTVELDNGDRVHLAIDPNLKVEFKAKPRATSKRK